MSKVLGILFLAMIAGSVNANLAVSANQIVVGQPVTINAECMVGTLCTISGDGFSRSLMGDSFGTISTVDYPTIGTHTYTWVGRIYGFDGVLTDHTVVTVVANDADTVDGQHASDLNDFVVNYTDYINNSIRNDLTSGILIPYYSWNSNYSQYAGYAFDAGHANWANYALQAGNAQNLGGIPWYRYATKNWVRGYTYDKATIDAKDAQTLSDANVYTDAVNQTQTIWNQAEHNVLGERITDETNRATQRENQIEVDSLSRDADLQAQINKNNQVDADQGSAINDILSQIVFLRKDVTELQGAVFEYETDKNYNDFPEKCGIFTKARLSNEGEVQDYETTFKTVADKRTRTALDNYVGVAQGTQKNTRLTEEVCWNLNNNDIPSNYGYDNAADLNGDGNIAPSENKIFCVVYPALESERKEYPCDLQKVFQSKDGDAFVIQKTGAGKPRLVYVSLEDIHQMKMNELNSLKTTKQVVNTMGYINGLIHR